MDRTCFLFLVVLQLATCLPLSVANNNTRDLKALLAFKAAIYDPHNILPVNWSTSTSVCNWIGITCNTRHQRVAAIDLSNMDLVGTIPPKLGNLSFLVYFNIINNSFHGELPKELAQLRRLKYIDLEGNGFAGEFPSWLAALTRLQYLSFLHNKFSGSLSGRIFNSTKLETIKLAYNLLTGNLPQELALPKLQWLDISFNKLSGPLPRALFNLSSLQRISVTNNSLSGYLPALICNHLPLLQGLYFSLNNFEGEIPSGIGECSRLQILSLSYNQFVGDIPKGIWNLTTLRLLYLGGNNVTGEIPEAIRNLHNLEGLGLERVPVTGGSLEQSKTSLINLSQNFTCNSSLECTEERQGVPKMLVIWQCAIPQAVCNLSKLELIHLDTNRLSGPIPLKLFNSSTLRFISLANNDFLGELPSTLGVSLPKLEELYLGGNKLSGLVLTSISNASRLRTLALSNNQFTGAIPHSLGNLRFLEILSLHENYFSGDPITEELSFFNSLTECRNLVILAIALNPLNGFLPSSFGNLSNSIDLIEASYCGIKGEIPGSIGNLSNLATFSLAVNVLKGIIPSSIKGLLKLQRIRLGDNEIQGPIPNEICHLLNLGKLSLGRNMLSSMVPSCIGNITSLSFLYLDSNNLTSSLPASLWSLRDILEVDMSMNSLTGSLPAQIGNLKALVKLNLSMNELFGEIPRSIGALQNLQTLSLEHNKLQGLIPDSMKDMFSLEYLELSFNNLSGEIPKSIDVLSHLQYINVSYNRLRGPVPREGAFLNFTKLSFLSNEALCGAPWLQSCPTFEHRLRAKKLALFTSLGVGSAMLALIFSFLLLRKRRRNIASQSDDFFPIITHERVSFHELNQITNGFSESALLGSGTFGSVYKGVRENGMIWAIKVFDLELEGAFKSFDRECEVLCCLRHRNLNKVISACSSPNFKALVLEYMPNGSLEKWLYLEGHFLSIAQRLDVMIDVASGLEYLHYGYSIPVVHCDLKPSNILLDQDMVGHVSDFGIAKLLGDGESMVHTNTMATFGYIAPEYGLEGLVSARCDVYSFGITLMETFTRRRPDDEMFNEELSLRRWIQELLPDSVTQVIDGNLLFLEDKLVKKKMECISSILQLALSCTTDAPEERINIRDALVALHKIKSQFYNVLKP